MIRTIQHIFKARSSNSADAARDRLELLLRAERLNLTDAQLDQLRAELCHLLGRYFDIDCDALDVGLDSLDGDAKLLISGLVADTQRRTVARPAIQK